jgi:PAS domain S-box-containing protein
LALRVGEAVSLDDVFQRIVEGLAAESGVALARVWLTLPDAGCASCRMRPESPDQSLSLHLVASAGTPTASAEDWSYLEGYFHRIPLGLRKVGQIGASGTPVLISDNLAASPWIARPDWARRESILSFAGQPLIFRGETLGVLAVFSRAEITPSESDWLRIFADHAAIAIANARGFEELKRAEAEVRESEERYRHIFQSVGVSIWEEDFSAVKTAIDELKAQGVTDFPEYFATHPEFVQAAVGLVKILDVNHTTLALLEAQSKDELLGSLERVFLPETLQAFAGELVTIAEGRTLFESESALLTLKGNLRSVLFTVAFPTNSARFGSVLVSIMDITERKRLDNELRRSQAYLIAAQELSHVGSWAQRIDTGEQTWSEETFRIFGLDPAGPAPTLEQVRQAWHPDDRERVTQAIEAAAWEKRGNEVNLRIVRPDGSIREVYSKGEPVFDASGNLVEWIGVSIDVTEQRKAERALRRARKRELEARFAAVLEERTRLARDIHDTLLQGFTGIALKLVAATSRVTEPPESIAELRDLVGLAQQTLVEARRAVWDLRTPALDAGEFPTALRKAAEECTRRSELRLEYDVAGAERPIAQEIEEAMVRVLQEAITNAVKHAKAGTVRVRLSFRSRHVRLSIVDDGRGFVLDPDLHSYQGHWGLLGMRERASQVRGKLSLRSTPGAGTRVVLLVPYSSSRLPVAVTH